MAEPPAPDGEERVSDAVGASASALDPHDERLLGVGGAPPADASRGMHDARASEQEIDFDDDEPLDEGQSPLTTWISLLARTLLSAMHTVFSAVLFALFPIYCLVPAFVLDGLFRGVFRIGYLIYLTPVGEWLHLRGLRSNQPAHSAPVAAAQLTSSVVHTVPIMDNNYAYLLIDKATKACAVVDPADPYAVLRAVDSAGCTLTHILTTHHHHDHAGGNSELCARMREAHGRKLTVVGGRKDRVPACTMLVSDGDKVKLGETEILVLETPCHTRGHVCYCVLGGSAGVVGGTAAGAADTEAVFSGDTVFIGGVGAFFHGNAKDMDANLNTRLAGLPDSALLFCGHEYSVDNLRFAAWLEPENLEVVSRFLVATAKRNTGESTVPSTMGWERRTNPYFRARDERLKRAVDARAAWMERRRKRSVGERLWAGLTGRGGKPVAQGPTGRKQKTDEEAPSSPALVPRDDAASAAAVYDRLQSLLSSGLWQGFKLTTGSTASVRRRATQIAAISRSSPGMSAPLVSMQPEPNQSGTRAAFAMGDPVGGTASSVVNLSIRDAHLGAL